MTVEGLVQAFERQQRLDDLHRQVDEKRIALHADLIDAERSALEQAWRESVREVLQEESTAPPLVAWLCGGAIDDEEEESSSSDSDEEEPSE